MTNNLTIPKLNLQLFAEGGAGASGTAGSGSVGTGAEGTTSVTGVNAASQRKGVKSNPLANVIYGKQDDSGQTTTVQEKATATTESVQQVDRNAKFEITIFQFIQA